MVGLSHQQGGPRGPPVGRHAPTWSRIGADVDGKDVDDIQEFVPWSQQPQAQQQKLLQQCTPILPLQPPQQTQSHSKGRQKGSWSNSNSTWKKNTWNDDPNWDICWDFVDGYCARGDQCRWKHRYPNDENRAPSNVQPMPPSGYPAPVFGVPKMTSNGGIDVIRCSPSISPPDLRQPPSRPNGTTSQPYFGIPPNQPQLAEKKEQKQNKSPSKEQKQKNLMQELDELKTCGIPVDEVEKIKNTMSQNFEIKQDDDCLINDITSTIVDDVVSELIQTVASDILQKQQAEHIAQMNFDDDEEITEFEIGEIISDLSSDDLPQKAVINEGSHFADHESHTDESSSDTSSVSSTQEGPAPIQTKQVEQEVLTPPPGIRNDVPKRRRRPPPAPPRQASQTPSASSHSSKEETITKEEKVVSLKEACEICKGLGRLNPKTAGFIHVDSKRSARGRFGPGWYFANPIPFSVPKDMAVWADNEKRTLLRGSTVGIVFIYQDGRVSTAICDNGRQFTGCFRLPLFDDATESPITQPF